jgi:HEAT repeat protein
VEEIMPSLWKMLRGVDSEDVEFASWALGVLDSRDVGQITADLRSPSYDKRRAAAAALGELGWGASAAVPELTKVLWDTGSYRLRSLAARALGMVGVRAQSAIPTLQKTCRSDTRDEVREAAAAAIMGIQSPAVPPSVTTDRDTITLEELEEGIFHGNHASSSDFALTLKAMGRPIVPLLDYILQREGGHDSDRHETSAYPFNVLYALSHIGGQPALTTLRRFGAFMGADYDTQDMQNAILARWTIPNAGALICGGAAEMPSLYSADVSGITGGQVVDIICPSVPGLDIEEGSIGRWAFVQAASGERGYIIAEAMTDSLSPWY